ncbi:MAG: YidC/Oxa1 family membrane protein insertase [Candidatus Bipolaricaulaceae bacterium]
MNVLQVTTGLVRYQFTAEGTLRSAYIHFAPYGAQPMETVPGWQENTLAPGVSLPFEVWLGDTRLTTLWMWDTEPVGAGTIAVHLRADGAEIRGEKRFLLRQNALYTGEFRVQLEGSGLLRLVLGHLPGGKDAPELLYLYDGKLHKAPLAPGAYTRFQGLGLVGSETVFFFRLDEGEAVPFVGRNPAGQPVFGVEARETLRLRGTFYMGRNRYLLLKDGGFAALAQGGAFTLILAGVIRFFDALYAFTGNYGWAIILFTLITRVLLHPLTRSQFRSMAKMQRLAPKIKKLQERFKDDRESLQRQILELYRQEKVNPLGGCLPMLLQFPILIVLWQAIMYSAEKIHLSPGFLWIQDLSQPDPYYLLVILGTGVQLLYQWYTQRRLPADAAGGSQFLGYIFPLVMALFFLHFPAGLWLYWTFTTLFQFAQQLIIDWELAREGARTPAKPEDGSPSS